MNLLKSKFLQVSEKDLISPIVGETPKIVSKKIKEAKGGILFIDEAYSLMNSQAGKQAIDMLIQEMENKRGEFCLILAGYPDEIDELLKQNSGFNSRVDKVLVFEDYNEGELFEIFLRYVKENDFDITSEAKEKLKKVNGVKKVDIITISNEFDIENKNFEVEVIPFWRWRFAE